MYLCFIDESSAAAPSREGMNHLIAFGAVCLPASETQLLEQSIDSICRRYGFPPKEDKSGEFKWSPGKKLWLRNSLQGDQRTAFFLEVLEAAKSHRIQSIVVIEDTHYSKAIRASESHEEDAIHLLLERVNSFLRSVNDNGLVIIDRSGSASSTDERRLSSCLKLLLTGTDYVEFDKIALSVLSAPSHLIRLLQLADLVVGCVVQHVGGEDRFSPKPFESIKGSFLRGNDGRIGR
jgi:hypothetical protein